MRLYKLISCDFAHKSTCTVVWHTITRFQYCVCIATVFTDVLVLVLGVGV